MDQFVIFQKFDVREDALLLTDALEKKNIAYELETGSQEFNPAFTFKEEYRIKIRKEDFDRVSELYTEDVADDYYLFDFTSDELADIIAKPDEWSHFDFILAKKLLKERGKEIAPEKVEQLHEQRIQELRKPEKSKKGWIIAGYIFSILGGLFGLLIGWTILSTKKTLPTGETVYVYSESDRKHAKRIVIIGIFCAIPVLASRLLRNILEQM